MDVFPFSGGLYATANGWLTFSVVAALLYFAVLTNKQNLRRTIIKTLATGLLAVLAYHLGGPVFLVAALGFSAVGDAFLAHDGEQAFIGGLTAFLIAHIFYVLLFVAEGEGLRSIFEHIWRLIYATVIIVGSFLMATMLWKPVGRIKIPVMVYISVIAAMGISATLLAQPLALIGSLLFILSDTFLAIEKFLLTQENPASLPLRYAVWGLYYFGQLLIAFAFLV